MWFNRLLVNVFLCFCLLACKSSEFDKPTDIRPSIPTGMVVIPAGEFVMGFENGREEEKPPHAVYLDAFEIDRYEVTNVQYADFLNTKGNQTEGGSLWLDMQNSYVKITHDNDSYAFLPDYSNHPVVNVSWYGARAYCEWVGKRLPTEAEWEKAARDSSEGKRYPWGDEMGMHQANYLESGVGRTMPVDSYEPNQYGIYNMIGNVWEWCHDWYGSDYYVQSQYKNPTGPEMGNFRVLRGGSWGNKGENLRVSLRGSLPPKDRGDVDGFRCAK